MPPRTIATTATPFFVSSTTPSKAATSARENPTSTACAELSVNIIDQCVATACRSRVSTAACWIPARSAARRSRGRFTRAARPGQQLLLGVYQALERQIAAGTVHDVPAPRDAGSRARRRRARGIITRDMVTGEIEAHAARRGHPGDRRLQQRLLPVDQRASGCNATAIWRAHKQGAAFANPCYTQIHPTCIPQSGDYQSKLTLMSESLRNDGRVWVPTRAGDTRAPSQIPEGDRDYYLERKYPSFGNLAPRDIASRAAKEVCDDGLGRWPWRTRRVTSTLHDAIDRLGVDTIRERYANLFEMYERITGEDPYTAPMRIYPAAALHHGRLVGRLQLAEQHHRAVRRRRSQLLRPWRQPPRRKRADAGPGGRLLRAAGHDSRLPRLGAARPRRRRRTLLSRRRSRPSPSGSTNCCRCRASARWNRSTASWAR